MFRGSLAIPTLPRAGAGTRPRTSSGSRITAICLAGILAASSPILAAPHGSGSGSAESSPESGSSYWGEIPSPGDSVTVIIRPRSKSLWEHVLLTPYRIVGVPFNILTTGARVSVIYMDEHRWLGRARTLANVQIGSYRIGPRFQFDGLSGLGGGFTLSNDQILAPGNRLKLRWRSTTTGTHWGSLGIHMRERENTGYVVGVGYKLRPNARYFGSGPGAAETHESFYTQEAGWAGLSVRRDIPLGIEAEALALYSAVGARAPGDTDDASIPDRFSSVPLGYGERSKGVTLSFGLTRDTTRETGRPFNGGIQRLKVSYFEEIQDGSASFWTFRGDLEQFLPLWNSKQGLAFREYVTWIKTAEWDELPFQRHLTNDDPDLFRGFRNFRWRGRGITAVSAEYRWPLWALTDADGIGADTYLFSDVGQVFGDADELSTNHLTYSYGFGVRLASLAGFQGRLEIGWSDEEMVVRASADQIFQFAKYGLIHGRDQVALR